jgi:phosphatidylglycerophosphate synthase
MSSASDPPVAVDSVRAVLRRLSAAQKSNRGAPAYSRWVNRPVGRLIAAVAFRLNLVPNQVTAMSALLTFTGISLIAAVPPTVINGVVIALLLMLGFAFDAADGQLARLRGGGSPVGEWLDHVVDCIKCSTLHIAVLISWYRFFDLESWTLAIPIIFSVESSVFFFTIILTEQLRRSARGINSASIPDSTEAAPVSRSFVVLPADYGFLCCVFVLLGFHMLFVWVYGLLALANVGYLVGGFYRWFRVVSRLSPATRP